MQANGAVATSAAASANGPRDHNEDRVITSMSSTGEVAFAAVADGMGGQAGGAVASQLAADGLRRRLELKGAARTLDSDWLAGVIDEINDRIRRQAEAPGLRGMGTTLAAVLATRSEVVIANIGDSRCYCIGPTGIERLTEDHSVTADAVRRGLLAPGLAADHPYAHALTRALGTDPTAAPDIASYPVPSGAVYVVCSDGVWNVLDNAEIDAVVRNSESLEKSAEGIVASALAAGTNDNASVVLLELGKLRRSPDALLPVQAAAAERTIRLRPLRSTARRRAVLAALAAALVTIAGLAYWGAKALTRVPGSRSHGSAPTRESVDLPAATLTPSRTLWIFAGPTDSARVTIRGREIGWVGPGTPLAIEARSGEVLHLRRFPAGATVSFVVGPETPDSIRLTPGRRRGW